MPKGHPLSEGQKAAIYNAYTMGESHEDIAMTYGIAAGTVSRIVSGQRKVRTMAAREKVVAGNKASGRLTSTTDPHRYEGTCVVGGKRHSKVFVNVNARKATEMWERWCQELRDEQAFMDMVERKPAEEPGETEQTAEVEQQEGEVPIDPAPVPEIEVVRWRDVAEERQGRIEELEARVAELEAREQDGATDKPVYVLWAKSAEPRFYGAYRHMGDALGEMDRLNDVAAFLCSESSFEVNEVMWRG